jgi:excisionase family DNA binding protein
VTDPKSMIVQLTVADLKALIAEAVAEGAAKARPTELEYLTLAQAAKLLGCDERTVTTYIKTRELPAVKLGHEWRFASAELSTWMADRKFKVKKAG